MAKYTPLHVIKDIQGNFGGARFFRRDGKLTFGPPIKTGKHPKTKAEHISDCACAAWKKCDEYYQIKKRDPEWVEHWRSGIKKPGISVYDYFMTDCLTWFNAGCSFDGLGSSHGGYSWNVEECDNPGDFAPPEQ